MESEDPNYTIDFLKKENSFSVDSKFKMIDNGDYELFFSTKEFIPPEIFRNAITIIQSDWYNIVFDNIYTQQIESTFYMSEKPNDYRITTKSFRTSIDEIWEDTYICAFYKYDHKIFNPDNSCVLGIKNKTIEIRIEEFELIIFWGERTTPKGLGKDERFMMLFSKTRTDLSTFKRLAEAIRVSWGLISGYYIGESVYYMSCKPELGLNGLHFAYNNLQEEIVTYRGMLDNKTPDNILENDIHLTRIEFERLIYLLYKSDDLLRAGHLLIIASKDEDTIKGGLASIALETITGEIERELKTQNKNKTNDLILPPKLRDKIQDVINSFKEDNEISNKQQEHYLKRLNDFSKPLNSEKLSMPFSYLNITLSNTEKEIINNRNDFLHGNLPKKAKGLVFESQLDSKELKFYVSNKLILLCTMLLFRMADKEMDKLINDWGVTIIVKKRLMTKGKYRGNSGVMLRRLSDNNPEEDSPEWLV